MNSNIFLWPAGPVWLIPAPPSPPFPFTLPFFFVLSHTVHFLQSSADRKPSFCLGYTGAGVPILATSCQFMSRSSLVADHLVWIDVPTPMSSIHIIITIFLITSIISWNYVVPRFTYMFMSYLHQSKTLIKAGPLFIIFAVCPVPGKQPNTEKGTNVRGLTSVLMSVLMSED